MTRLRRYPRPLFNPSHGSFLCASQGWEILVRAFVKAFNAQDNVTLYLRAGRDKERPQKDIASLLKELKVEEPPAVGSASRSNVGQRGVQSV